MFNSSYWFNDLVFMDRSIKFLRRVNATLEFTFSFYKYRTYYSSEYEDNTICLIVRHLVTGSTKDEV